MQKYFSNIKIFVAQFTLRIRCPIQFNYCMSSASVTIVWMIDYLPCAIHIVSPDKVPSSYINIQLWKQTTELWRTCLIDHYTWPLYIIKAEIYKPKVWVFNSSIYNWDFVIFVSWVLFWGSLEDMKTASNGHQEAFESSQDHKNWSTWQVKKRKLIPLSPEHLIVNSCS